MEKLYVYYQIYVFLIHLINYGFPKKYEILKMIQINLRSIPTWVFFLKKNKEDYKEMIYQLKIYMRTSMVQWVWTSWDKSLFNSITWVNLTSCWSRLHRRVLTVVVVVVVMLLMLMPEGPGEVCFASSHSFPVARTRVMRDRYVAIVINACHDVLGIETEPPLKEYQQQKNEPKNGSKKMKGPQSHGLLVEAEERRDGMEISKNFKG